MNTPVKVVAAVGLILGAIFGLAGTVVTEQKLRAAAWGIDSVGLVVATCLLALRYFRKGNDCVAAGFLVFAIGEGVMLSGTAATLAASVPSFAAGTALVRSPSAHEYPQGICSVDSPGRHGRRPSLCDYGGKNFLG